MSRLMMPPTPDPTAPGKWTYTIEEPVRYDPEEHDADHSLLEQVGKLEKEIEWRRVAFTGLAFLAGLFSGVGLSPWLSLLF